MWLLSVHLSERAVKNRLITTAKQLLYVAEIIKLLSVFCSFSNGAFASSLLCMSLSQEISVSYFGTHLFKVCFHYIDSIQSNYYTVHLSKVCFHYTDSIESHTVYIPVGWFSSLLQFCQGKTL